MLAEVSTTHVNIDMYDDERMEKHIKRAVKLANATIGSGHSNFLKGIVVQCDVEAASYVWPQIQRYRFFEIVSSTSKMHTIKLEDGETWEDRLGSMIMDYELTAGISTNYMAIKNMYHQRKNHRLKFWNTIFVDWVKSLPMAKELITGES